MPKTLQVRENEFDDLAIDDLFENTDQSFDSLLERSLGDLGLDQLELPLRSKKKALDNAERCRRHREKQKAEKHKATIENKNLKRERTSLLETIARLQNEVQYLRGEGAVDFTLENLLLKAEIKKHRQYIEAVVNLSKMGPVVSKAEENIRLLKSGVESGIGQVVGLMYSSMGSDDWKEGVPINLKLDFEGETVEVLLRFWYQYLPLGTTAKESHRVNMRTDLIDFPLSADTMVEMSRAIMRNKEATDATAKQFGSHYEVDEVIPMQVLENGESLGCTRIKSDLDGVKHEDLGAHAYKEVEIYPSAFAKHHGELDLKRKLPIFVYTSCNLDIEPREGFERVREILVKGSTIVASGEQQSVVVSVASFPTEGGLYGQALGGEPIVNDDGELLAEYVDTMRNMCLESLQQAKTLHRKR